MEVGRFWEVVKQGKKPSECFVEVEFLKGTVVDYDAEVTEVGKTGQVFGWNGAWNS